MNLKFQRVWNGRSYLWLLLNTKNPYGPPVACLNSKQMRILLESYESAPSSDILAVTDMMDAAAKRVANPSSVHSEHVKHDLWLTGIAPNKLISVVKAVRECTGWGLMPSKQVCDIVKDKGITYKILNNVKLSEVNRAQSIITNAGAKVLVSEHFSHHICSCC